MSWNDMSLRIPPLSDELRAAYVEEHHARAVMMALVRPMTQREGASVVTLARLVMPLSLSMPQEPFGPAFDAAYDNWRRATDRRFMLEEDAIGPWQEIRQHVTVQSKPDATKPETIS